MIYELKKMNCNFLHKQWCKQYALHNLYETCVFLELGLALIDFIFINKLIKQTHQTNSSNKLIKQTHQTNSSNKLIKQTHQIKFKMKSCNPDRLLFFFISAQPFRLGSYGFQSWFFVVSWHRALWDFSINFHFWCVVLTDLWLRNRTLIHRKSHIC